VDGPDEILRLTLADGVLVMAGDADTSTSRRLDDALTELDASRPAQLEMSQVTFMDSSCLRVLITHHLQRPEFESRVELIAPSDPVRLLLRVSGMTDLFVIRDR
jgi:anti-sigma B factor antagonist